MSRKNSEYFVMQKSMMNIGEKNEKTGMVVQYGQ